MSIVGIAAGFQLSASFQLVSSTTSRPFQTRALFATVIVCVIGQPLAKVASGGELSRISLAIQVITAQQDHTPTLIFDEVDVGIGGRVAEIVGKLLRQLGNKAQVLCVTHLPVIACQADRQFRIISDLNYQIYDCLQQHNIPLTPEIGQK